MGFAVWKRTTKYLSTKVSIAASCIYKGVQKPFKNGKGCRIDTGACKKALPKKDPPKTLGTRVSCKTSTGLGGQRTRQTYRARQA